MFLGIEIGGTKLQLGVGRDDGRLAGLWRGSIDAAHGPDGIRRQIINAVPELLAQANIDRHALFAVGVGFGGPVEDATQRIIKSHQISGWDDFPLAEWMSGLLGLPTILGNDADVAGLAEARHGAGQGLTPIFYVTVGSGIGGGLILNGRIHRGIGRGAAEIGHLRFLADEKYHTLESLASGWGIEQRVQARLGKNLAQDSRRRLEPETLTAQRIAELAREGEPICRQTLDSALDTLAEALCHVIALICPRRIVIGGGVSLIGEADFFEPLRQRVAERVFRPFLGLTDIVPAALGEEVVVHGAIALARENHVS